MPTVTPVPYVLVTGGAGYIGSHTIVELLNAGKNVVVVDNLCNSSKLSLERVKIITQLDDPSRLLFYKVDITDKAALSEVFSTHTIVAVVHFAGLKAVNESISKPLQYYNTNVFGTSILLECMKEAGCANIVFSSSATVYGNPQTMPIYEDHPLGPINPYGRSKYMAELLIQDFVSANSGSNAALLRYFNPIGAHPSGLIGESPNDVPNNLVPYVTQVMCGKLERLRVFGHTYPTKDGTGVRDFIHVVDLAKGHLAALNHLMDASPGCLAVNMGTGTGYSVLDIVKTMEATSGLTIPYELQGPRAGDAAEVVANADSAFEKLKWKAELTLANMCATAWNWQRLNPSGY